MTTVIWSLVGDRLKQPPEDDHASASWSHTHMTTLDVKDCCIGKHLSGSSAKSARAQPSDHSSVS